MSYAIYAKDVDGSPVIPASQRPDGTWRKQRRVKEGYVPQEEVPLYESKGKQFAKCKPQLPVGMTAIINTSHHSLPINKRCPIPGLVIEEDFMKKIKNKKKSVNNNVSNADKLVNKFSQITIKEPAAPAQDPAKRLKNLKKKLREIETIEQKIKSAEIKNPEKEQLEKISRKSEVLNDIENLEKLLK